MWWFFKVTIILSLIKDASYTQALYMHVLIRRITMNLSSVYLFFMVKRENNAVPEIFMMFSIVQMMFIKEVILIRWEFCMIRPRVERRDRLVKNKINVGNLPLFYWRIFYKNSLIEFAPQRCFILLFSVCVMGNSIYPEVTRYTLEWWSKKSFDRV